MSINLCFNWKGIFHQRKHWWKWPLELVSHKALPISCCHCVPEGDYTWEILMLLKDIIGLVVAPRHTEETLHFMECKLTEHRRLLQSTLPGFWLKPKHHYLEHYPYLVRKFGPLCDVWTMHFEGKHKFF